MKNPFIQEWIQQLNEDLQSGDVARLESSTHRAGLGLIQDPDFLSEARRKNLPPLVVFIATLLLNNAPATELHAKTLAVYQWILGSIDEAKAVEQCCSFAPASRAFYQHWIKGLKALQGEADFAGLRGRESDFVFAMEVLADLKRYEDVLALLIAWRKKDASAKPVLLACRILTQRVEYATRAQDAKALAHLLSEVTMWVPAQHAAVLGSLRKQIGQLAMKGGDYSLAEKTYQSVLRQDPALEHVYALAKANMLNGHHDQALPLLEQVVTRMIESPAEQSLEPDVPQPIFSTAQAMQTLNTVSHLLRQKGLKPFLMSGTLLGFMRQGGLLPHDKDLDLGLIGWQSQFDVAQALLDAGHFRINIKKLRGDKTFLFSAIDVQTGITVDFFLFHDQGSHFLHGIDTDAGVTLNFEFSKFGLQERVFGDETYWIPDSPEVNLTENYGDWRIPQPDYVVTVESPAIRQPGSTAHRLIALLDLIKIVGKKLAPNKARRILRYAEEHPVGLLSQNVFRSVARWVDQNDLTPEEKYGRLMAKLRPGAVNPVSVNSGPDKVPRVLLVGHGFGPDGASMMLQKTARHWSNTLGWQVHGLVVDPAHEDSMQRHGIQAVHSMHAQEYDLVVFNTLLVAKKAFELHTSARKLLWVHEGESVLMSSSMSASAWTALFEAFQGVVFQTRWQSEILYRSFTRRMSSESIHIVPNGLDWTPQHLTPRNQRQAGQFHVVCVGSLTARKRPHDLANAVMQLATQTSIRLTLVGDKARIETLPSQFQQLVANGHAAVHCVGSLDQTAIAHLLSEADAFCLPSGDESYPLAPMEAACAGLPVILSDLPPYNDMGWIHGLNCLKYPVGDVSALMNCLQQLIQNPQHSQALANAAAQWVSSKSFSEYLDAITAVALPLTQTRRSV